MNALIAWVSRPGFVRACRIVLGLIFAAAALAKIGDLDAFARSIRNFQLVPVATQNILAMTVPWIELVASIALVVGVRSRAAAVLITSLLAVFTLAIASAMFRGLSFECGCFGKAEASTVGWIKLGENLAMLAVGAVAMLRGRTDA